MFDPSKRNNLIVLKPNQVRQYWHLVRPGLDYMVSEKRNPDGWLPEEVFNLLMSGKADLAFTSMMRGDQWDKGMRYSSEDVAIADSSGFVVLMNSGTFSEKALHIWIAVSNETTNKDGAASIMQTFNVELNVIAKTCGYQAITFNSNQDWWGKVAPRFGFEKQETKWRKEVV